MDCWLEECESKRKKTWCSIRVASRVCPNDMALQTNGFLSSHMKRCPQSLYLILPSPAQSTPMKSEIRLTDVVFKESHFA